MNTKAKLPNARKATLPRSLFSIGMILCLLALPLVGCSVTDQPEDEMNTGQEFSIDLSTTEDQLQAELIVSNPGDTEFPGDNEFEGMSKLWNQTGEESRATSDSYILEPIAAGESRVVTTLNLELEPGVYFMAWGDPQYGGVLTTFVLENMLSGAPEVVRSFSFQTEAADYGSNISNAGMIKSFSQAEDGSIIITGETPIPDQNCVFPLLYSQEGLVDSFPAGECAQVAEGQWLLEVTAPPGSGGIQLVEGENYHVIVFSDDLNIAPSEPFEVLISPPAQE